MKKYPVHLIAKPTLLDDITFDNGNTENIIDTIVKHGDKHCGDFTKKFAPFLKGKTVLETCGNIHEFVKTQIPYVLDPRGVQYIKSPGRLFHDKAGDCKSFSVFTASILKNLGIEYGYRFVSYKGDDATPTHVYVYVPAGSTEIIIDAVWNGPFNTQKPYAHKKDILMPQIMYLGATDSDHISGVLNIPEDHYERMTEGELTLRLARQKLEIDKMNAESLGGFWKTPGYNRSLHLVNHMIRNVDRPEVIMAIGEHFEKHPDVHIAGLGKFIKKVGKGIAKGAKAVAKTAVKAVTFAPKLIIKGVMEIYLPKAAPMFLYLFTAPGINLPDKMRRKKEKAEKFKRFVCGKVGMKEAHFMSIIRNALTKKYRQSPEAYLAAELKKAGISGIGKVKKAKVNKQRAKPLNMQLRTSASSLMSQAPQSANVNLPQFQNVANKVNDLKEAGEGVKNVVNQVASGNILGAVMSAISWIIQKLGGSKEDSLSADDMPDVEGDAGNAFKYQDLQKDYSNLSSDQRYEVKDTVSSLIDRNAGQEETRQTLNRINYLNDEQRQEMTGEVEEGYEPLSESETASLANQIKQGGNTDPYSNGGGSGAMCKC